MKNVKILKLAGFYHYKWWKWKVQNFEFGGNELFFQIPNNEMFTFPQFWLIWKKKLNWWKLELVEFIYFNFITGAFELQFYDGSRISITPDSNTIIFNDSGGSSQVYNAKEACMPELVRQKFCLVPKALQCFVSAPASKQAMLRWWWITFPLLHWVFVGYWTK